MEVIIRPIQAIGSIIAFFPVLENILFIFSLPFLSKPIIILKMHGLNQVLSLIDATTLFQCIKTPGKYFFSLMYQLIKILIFL